MIFDMTDLNGSFLDKLPQATIQKKIPTGGYSYDPVTKKQTLAYSDLEDVSAYVGNWSLKEIQNSNNLLTLESKKVLLKGSSISQGTILVIDDDEFKIDYQEPKQGYIVLGVSAR